MHRDFPNVISCMPEPFKSVKIGDRSLRYVCSGEGDVTVIIDHGMGISAESGLSRLFTLGWAKVFLEVRQFTRICMYDGVGQRDPAPPPRTSREMVKDLRALLRNADIPGPYVLVGHSIGGFNSLLYAHRYPKEVAGVVLVDSSHPDQVARLSAVLPPYSAKEPAMVRALRRPGERVGAAAFDMITSAAQVKRISSLGTVPLTVLSRSPHQPISSETSVEVASAVEQVWSELQADLLKLSTRSTQVVAAHAGHNMQLDEPQLVIDAILRAALAAGLGKSLLH